MVEEKGAPFVSTEKVQSVMISWVRDSGTMDTPSDNVHGASGYEISAAFDSDENKLRSWF